MERLSAEGKFFHRSCFKCEYCGTTLRLSSYAFDVEDGKSSTRPWTSAEKGSFGLFVCFYTRLFTLQGSFTASRITVTACLATPRESAPLPPQLLSPLRYSGYSLESSDSAIHSARLANTCPTPCSVRLRRRTRRPKQEWRPWMPPGGRRRRPPSSSRPQVAHFRVLPWRLLPAVWPRVQWFHCVASAVHFPGLATRWRSTP